MSKKNLVEKPKTFPETTPNLSNYIEYKQNHQKLPILILPNHHILVYVQSTGFKSIEKYLVCFCESVNRPRYIHEYKISKFSLYTAMVLQYSSQQIINILKISSKNLKFPKTLENIIQEYMQYAGKVRMKLVNGKYQLFTIPQIQLLLGDMIEKRQEIDVSLVQNLHLNEIKQQMLDQEVQLVQEKLLRLNRYDIKDDYFKVTRKLIENSIPLIQEYEFEKDLKKRKIQIDLCQNVVLRYYQQRALKNVIIDNKARSGIIILPCGAGKSLVAILILQRLKTNAIIFCQNQISVDQWKQQLIKWTNINPNKIIKLSGKNKDTFHVKDYVIFITTYTMVGRARQRINDTLKKTQQMEWGICIADQVHKLPAETFQNVLKKYLFNVKIGLTATPYRQDKKIDNLFYMIGPKLFQQNWLDLVKQGCIARPYCVQIRCPMTKIFKDQYDQLKGRQLIHTANPTKFTVLQYLLKIHLSRGDKILVFCDRPKILDYYAKILKHAIIHGQIASEQRSKIYNLFKKTKQLNVIFLSRVGDTAIDLPCANVAIQIGMHYKSRRQQIQRMGRIMRAKQNPYNDYNAFFYSLVSLDTNQMMYSNIRQKCLINQGFEYEIIMEEDLEYHKNAEQHQYIKPLNEVEYLTDLLINHEQGNLAMKQIKQQGKIIKKSIEQTIVMEYNQIQL